MGELFSIFLLESCSHLLKSPRKFSGLLNWITRLIEFSFVIIYNGRAHSGPSVSNSIKQRLSFFSRPRARSRLPAVTLSERTAPADCVDICLVLCAIEEDLGINTLLHTG